MEARMAIKLRALVILGCALGLPALTPGPEAWAAPSISTASGSFSQGSTVTIGGSGFGSKGGTDPNRPLIWADFENSINPTNLGVVLDWSGISNLSLHTGGPQHGLSTQNIVGTYDPSQMAHNFQLNRSYTSKIYLYGKRYYNFARPANLKVFRLWANKQGWDLVASNHGSGLFLNEGCALDPDAYQGFSWIQNTWNIEEFRVDIGTVDNCSGNAGNALYEWVRNGTRLQFDSTMTNGTTQGATYGRLIVLDNFTDTPPPTGSRVYMDDLYVDDTWAHVMIGNASTLAASTQREIQIPSAWSNTSITIRVNRGSFGSLDNAYLYVIDANGAVNTNGFKLCAPACQSSSPAKPANLRVQ